MYLLYLDESGDPNNWDNQLCYVIGGVAVFEGKIRDLSNVMDLIQKKYFPEIKIPIEFHAHDIKKGHSPHFRKFSRDKNEEILNDVYSAISTCTFPGLAVFASAIDVEAVDGDARRDVFEQICMKFNFFLKDLFDNRKGRFDKGLLVIDRNQEHQFLQLIDNFKKAGTKGGYLGYIVDIPYFGKCNQTRMLQLADFVSYAVYQCYEHDDDTYLEMIKPRIYTGKIVKRYSNGLSHIIKKDCDCISCFGKNKVE
jgi:hypothetical protein